MTIDLKELKWTKNIKSHHIPWAYPHIQTGENFLLNWKTEQESNARKPQTNDVTILIQWARITHIVEIIDDILYQEKTDSDYTNCRFVKAVWVTPQEDWNNSPHKNDVFDFDFFCCGGLIKHLETQTFRQHWDNLGGLQAFKNHFQQQLSLH